MIVSCGAIGSPRLLQLSGVGPADELRKAGVAVVHDLPGVGANLQDHLDLYAISECTGDHTYDRVAQPHRTVWAGLQYLLFKTGPVTSTLFETGGFWYADKQARSPDIQFHLGLGSGIEAGVAQMKNPGVTLNSAFLRPRSRGTVRLASADPKAAPLIDPNYWADPYDRACAIKGLRLAREILRQPALKPFILAERLPGDGLDSDEELAEYAYRSAKTDHHPVGTCAMGAVTRDDARPAPARDRGSARRRRLGDAVRALLQHQRADDHGGGKGGRHDPRQAAAARGVTKAQGRERQSGLSTGEFGFVSNRTHRASPSSAPASPASPPPIISSSAAPR